MSHTPGPFTIEGPSQRQLPNDLGGDYAILSPDGKIIAECFHIVDEETYADALANACLFIAAEDLLKACEMGLEAIYCFHPVLRNTSDKALAEMASRGGHITEKVLALRTAIAKARGEPNA